MLDSMRENGGPPPALSEQTLRLVGNWRRVCSEFLPLRPDDSLWRYSRGWLPSDPHQGWKIHISATILTASDVLESVGPYLSASGAAFKAPATLDDLSRINAGLWHGYSQVGKFMTVYPANEDQFRGLVKDLHSIIPENIAAPMIPFDRRYRTGNIFYRYGSFVAKGTSEPTLRSPEGKLVPDRRDVPAPEWAASPFPEDEFARDPAADTPLTTRYHVFRSLSQRGKGGVYEAVDTGAGTPRLCIIKEGRRNGETAWDGRDARSRVENEAKVLADLNRKGLSVPTIYDSFEIGGNFYLVLEKIAGKSLQQMLSQRKRRLSLAKVLYICKQVAGLAAEIHAAGWVWRDCKPANLFISSDGIIRPIDFEGACPIDELDPLPWSTPNFTAPEVFRQKPANAMHSHIAEDLYSLGATLFYVAEGKLPPNISDRTADNRARTAVKFSRRAVPGPVKQLISRLLSFEPAQRPSAEEVFESLTSSIIKSHLPQKIGEPYVVADRIE
jgi:hypothetical protein